MTRQEYYDLLVRSAGDGTFPSYNMEQGVCEYRSNDKLHACAIGVLIPAPKAKTIIGTLNSIALSAGTTNAKGLTMLDIIAPYCPEGMSIKDLRTVQQVHDEWAFDCDGDAAHWQGRFFIQALNNLDVFVNVRRFEPLETSV